MFREIDPRNSAAVAAEILAVYTSLFPGANPAFIQAAFGWAENAFLGRLPDYQPIDVRYHDFSHTLQVTLCFARLLQGYKNAGAQPELTPRGFELALLAMLLHDTGYLKERGDDEGTGAKYTLVHVARSARFAEAILGREHLPPHEILAVQNMIRCTGVNTDFSAIPFQNELEKILGFGLATADLIGQMAAPDYVERLDILFQEFEESNRHNGRVAGPGTFESAEDLASQTPAFWENYVLPRINRDFLGLHRYLARPDAAGENFYLRRVECNMARLRDRNRTEG